MKHRIKLCVLYVNIFTLEMFTKVYLIIVDINKLYILNFRI